VTAVKADIVDEALISRRRIEVIDSTYLVSSDNNAHELRSAGKLRITKSRRADVNDPDIAFRANPQGIDAHEPGAGGLSFSPIVARADVIIKTLLIIFLFLVFSSLRRRFERRELIG